METQADYLTKKTPKWVFPSIFIAGWIFGMQSTAIYFLAGDKSNQVSIASPVHQATNANHVLAASVANPTAAQTLIDPAKPSDPLPAPNLADSLGLSNKMKSKTPRELGGDFFLGSNDVDYLVPLDTPPDKAREMLTEKLSTLPGITLGNGDKELIIVFDPLCPVCHDLIKELQSDDPVAKSVKATLLPANYFAHNKNSILASLYMLTKNKTGQTELAKNFLKDLVSGVQPVMEPIDTIPDDVIDNINKATMAILQTGSRVPLVIFRDSKTGELELFSGRPSLSEISQAGKLKRSGS